MFMSNTSYVLYLMYSYNINMTYIYNLKLKNDLIYIKLINISFNMDESHLPIEIIGEIINKL